MLGGRAQGKDVLEGLVFTSPTGRPIDDHNFSQRIWRRLCENLAYFTENSITLATPSHPTPSSKVQHYLTLPTCSVTPTLEWLPKSTESRSPSTASILTALNLHSIAHLAAPNCTQVQPHFKTPNRGRSEDLKVGSKFYKLWT